MSSDIEPSPPPKPNRRLVSVFVPLVVLLVGCGLALVSRIYGPLRTPADIQRPNDNEGHSLNVRIVKDKATAAAIGKAQRAIVYVDAPYSPTAVMNGQKYLRGMLHLSQHAAEISAEVYWIENDSDDWCKEWITTFGINDLMEVAVPVGHGAILWLESGKVVRFQLGHQIKGPYDIYELTIQQWKKAR